MGVGKDEDYGAVVGYEPTTAGECGIGAVPITFPLNLHAINPHPQEWFSRFLGGGSVLNEMEP